MLLWAAFAHAESTYGVPVDGFPSADERSLLLWTNAARVAPDAFSDDYTAGGCSTDDFSDDELTPKPPLYIDLDLTEVARVHSTDMAENGCFQHESCDGTDTWERIAEYYTDTSSALGENIAYGYGTTRNTMLAGWMCSDSGHRANIMSGDFNEMGAGVDGDHMTQDFAGGMLREGDPPVRVAMLEGGVYYADWGASAAPAELSIVRDGRATPMALLWGTEENGVYSVTDVAEDEDMTEHIWFVSWDSGSESGSFPATGSLTDDSSFDEARLEPFDVDSVREGLHLVGCATAPGAETPALAMLAVLVFGRRGQPGRWTNNAVLSPRKRLTKSRAGP